MFCPSHLTDRPGIRLQEQTPEIMLGRIPEMIFARVPELIPGRVPKMIIVRTTGVDRGLDQGIDLRVIGELHHLLQTALESVTTARVMVT